MRWFVYLCILLPFWTKAQLKKVYTDPVANNEVRGISFLNTTEGFVAFHDWIGYTTNGGRTFEKKYITNTNVDWNGLLPVNLTSGFYTNGIHAIDNSTFLVYGNYGFVPAILISYDRGNSFKLVYHSTVRFDINNDGIRKLVYLPGTQTAYAIEKDRMLRTTNGGQSWSILLEQYNADFTQLEFNSVTTGFIQSDKLYKTIDGGLSWTTVSTPGKVTAISFINPQKGWIASGETVYQTDNSGMSWTAKNVSGFEGAGLMKFVNDSVGYNIGSRFEVRATSDAGKYWEPVVRDNAFEYLNYTHNSIFTLSQGFFWVGGIHGFLERSDNSQLPTLPLAAFTIDTTDLASQNKVRLLNQSKPGYSYRWYRNGQEIATTYDAEFASSRLSIDTFRLVVIKGGNSASDKQIIDLRLDQRRCFATFSASTDTNAVSFNPGYISSGIIHTWDFGDGHTDSNSVSPVHIYDKVGVYTVTHSVYNPSDRCRSTQKMDVHILRTQKCLLIDFSTVADTFNFKTIEYKSKIDPTTELSPGTFNTYTWNLGNGKTFKEPQGKITYDSAGTYSICLSIKNYSTGCVSTVCKDIVVTGDSACDGRFRIKTENRNIYLAAKPSPAPLSRLHTWKFLQSGNVLREFPGGNQEEFVHTFFRMTYGESGAFNPSFGSGGSSCQQTAEILMDSLPDRIRHIVFDTITGCIDSSEQVFTQPRTTPLLIKATPDSNFSQRVTFQTYDPLIPGYYGGEYVSWRIERLYSSGYYEIGHTFQNGGMQQVSFASTKCRDDVREVYVFNVEVKPEPCPVYPPAFDTYVPGGNGMEWNFTQRPQPINQTLENKFVWYFGDGDSSLQYNPIHIYKTAGNFRVTLRYKNKNGCFRETTQLISVRPACDLSASFTLTRDSLSRSLVRLKNLSQSNSSQLSFYWHFGTRDSSSQKDPSYKYLAAGTYRISLRATASNGCTSSKDTIITVTASDLGVITSVNTVDPQPELTETIALFPNPANDRVKISLNAMRSGTTLISIYNQLGHPVKQLPFTVRPGNNDLFINLDALAAGVYTIQVSGLRFNLTSRFVKM